MKEKKNKHKLTTEMFIEKARKVHGDKYDYSLVNYKNNHTKVLIICPEHGIFELISTCHINRRQGCPYCTRPVHDTESFIKEANKKHNNFYNYSTVKYIKSNVKVKIICPIHGQFLLTPNDHLDGCGCPQCKSNKLHKAFCKTIETFILESEKVHGKFYNYDKVKYKNLHTPVNIVCPEHGNFFQEPASHIFLKSGCPMCTLKGQSIVYRKLKDVFCLHEILFEVNKSIVDWIGSQRLDIYFPEYNIAVEFDGRLHFMPIDKFGGQLLLLQQLTLDLHKDLLCEKNGCKLFRLKYNYSEDDFNNLCNNIKNIIDNYGKN